MSRIRQPHNDQLRDALASQYVLGTLKGAARRRFEKLLDSDPELRIRVQEWSHRLSPMAQGLEPVTPPDSVWRQIQARTQPQKKGLRLKQRFWESLNFWRGLSAATAVLLVAIVSVQMFPAATQSLAKNDQMMVIVNDNNARPAWVIETSARGKKMMVKTLHDVKMDPGMGCALWLTWDDGKAMFLGVLPEKSGMLELKKPPMPGRTLHNAKVVVNLIPMKNYDTKTIRGQLLFKQRFTII